MKREKKDYMQFQGADKFYSIVWGKPRLAAQKFVFWKHWAKG